MPLSLTLITIFILIYCQITQVVLSDTGISKEYVNGDCIIQARIDKLNQENILSNLAKSDGNIKIFIPCETRVYHRGVQAIIHYSPPRNTEACHFMNGRAGRETPDLWTAVMLYSNFIMKYCYHN